MKKLFLIIGAPGSGKTTDASIIHLATHANANEAPWVAFNDEKLFLNEIYTSRNQAELIVLSACNTAQGEIVKGEGILSLSRGFFYAGANSVLSNAWEANDKTASLIMQSFYGYLKDGETKAVALQKAKIDYLENHSLSEVSPSYWASFMLVGDYGEIAIADSFFQTYKYILLARILLLIILLIIYIKKKQKTRVTN